MTPWVAFALLGALLFAVGNALQKHALAGRLPAQSVRTLAARPLRFFLSFAGSRTSLSAVQSLFVLAIGVALLGERLLTREWLGVVVMLGGVWLLSPAAQLRGERG